ncbi:MAG: SagB/ThcOx family dehydrogenase [bacterium]
MKDYQLKKYRYFLKDSVRKTIDFSQTDQSKGIPPPPVEKPCPPGAKRINLVSHEDIKDIGLIQAIGNRESRRIYLDAPLSLQEISFLLWSTQGVRRRLDKSTALRTVPSAGARHALETYLCVLNVEGLDQGFYRYLALEHQLVFEFNEESTIEKISAATFGQSFIAQGAVIFIWTAVPYRMEWRYGLAAHRVIALDAGHVCQNLYLACEAIGAGTCGIAAYNQEAIDQLLRVDGEDEFTIYLAPVGKVPEDSE